MFTSYEISSSPPPPIFFLSFLFWRGWGGVNETLCKVTGKKMGDEENIRSMNFTDNSNKESPKRRHCLRTFQTLPTNVDLRTKWYKVQRSFTEIDASWLSLVIGQHCRTSPWNTRISQQDYFSALEKFLQHKQGQQDEHPCLTFHEPTK